MRISFHTEESPLQSRAISYSYAHECILILDNDNVK